MIKMLQYKMYQAGELRCPTTALVFFIFSRFHRHCLKNRTMLFPTTFISAPEKIGVGLKKQSANFLI